MIAEDVQGRAAGVLARVADGVADDGRAVDGVLGAKREGTLSCLMVRLLLGAIMVLILYVCSLCDFRTCVLNSISI